MGLKLVQVDAFTARPFYGNPAAVCVMSAPCTDADRMQAIALEMNLAETAFLWPAENGDGYSLRWFTPAVEVALCGHATLASAHILWQDGHLPPGAQARFHTKSGLLTADSVDDWIELDFPATPAERADPPLGLEAALGATARYVGRTAFDYLVELDSEATVRSLKPNHAALAELPVRGVIVTSAAAGPEFDFVSRFFAPGAGVAEDPVTGSSHCALTPFWGERLGKTEMVAYQASPRGGVIRVRNAGSCVKLGGQAVTTLRAELV